MSYIGRNINNLSDRAKLDSISTSATATFNLLLNSVAYVPSSAESLTVSLNGVIQAPQSSYTVSGSTIIFASNLASSDVIDFILAERAITLTTIGSGTVATSNIVDNAVTTDKLQIANTNTSVGNVRINDKSGDQSAGNPQYTFSNNTGTGMRRASSNIIAFDTNGTEAKRINATGQVTKPLQAYFHAVAASEQVNIGNGNTIAFGTEIIDTGGNFASNTFTAPVTGVYALDALINVNGYPANADYVWINIVTSNRTHKIFIQGNGLDNSSYYSLGGLAIADMDASDTAHITWEQSGASAEADVLASNTHFYGYLLG